MNSEKFKALIAWFLLVFFISVTIGTIHEIKSCNDGKLMYNSFWWECIKDE